MLKFLIASGHTPSGTIGCGAVGKLNESNCTREVAPLVVQKLKSLGYAATLIQFDKGNTYKCEDCYVRANQANTINGDLYVEIHFNSGINYKGDGAEVIVASPSSKSCSYAKNISKCLANTLNISNRGVKTGNFIVLNKTTMPAMIVECQFVDGLHCDQTYNAEKIADAIVEGLTGKKNSTTQKYKVGWNQDSKGWWYSPDGVTYYKDEWKLIDGEWYSFKSDGYARCSEWELYKDQWYFLDDSCKMVKSEWVEYKGSKYYLLPDGTMAVGHHKIGDKCFDFNQKGVLQ